MLEFNCTSCGQRLTLAESWAGKKCRCGSCGQILDVPHPLAVPANSSATRSPATPRPNLNVPASESGSRGHTPKEEPTIPPHPDKPRSVSASSVPAAILLPPDAELYDFLAPPQSPDEIGRLGAYRILKVLGGGGMGVVFQAEDLHLRRPVALKTMLPVLAASAANRRRFDQEARAAAAIEHDHIVTIYQVGEDRGVPFIAMQLLQGESLETRLSRAGRLSAAEVLRIARQTAIGLAVAHERGLIHRDVKPSNIWLEARGEGGRVKILDFGLARSVAGDANLTRSGAILGTPAYMAPEQARGQPVDHRADLFSLGCVLYRACTGQPPFRGADVISTLMAVAEHTPPPPHQLNPQVPAGLAALIMQLLAKDPAARPSSARVVVQKVQELEGEPVRDRSEIDALPPAMAIPVGPASEIGRQSELNDGTLLLTHEPTPVAHKKRLLLMGLVCLGVGCILLLTLGVIGLVLWLKSSPAGDSSLSASGTSESKVANGLDPAVQAVVRDAVQKKNYTKTNIVGFPFAAEFTEVPPEGALLIGLEFGIGRWEPNNVIHSIRAIYLSEKGESLGEVHGKPTERLMIVKAKPGYAVGAVSLNTHLLIDGMRVTFMRIDRKYLDADQSYWEKVGTIGEKAGEGTTIGGGGAMVIGICGKDDGRVCNAFGLVLRGKTDK
jgi:serine/threonine protein kinase